MMEFLFYILNYKPPCQVFEGEQFIRVLLENRRNNSYKI
jgi:hypothetical protein